MLDSVPAANERASIVLFWVNWFIFERFFCGFAVSVLFKKCVKSFQEKGTMKRRKEISI